MNLQEFEDIYRGIDSRKREIVAKSISNHDLYNGKFYYGKIQEEIKDSSEETNFKKFDLESILSELIYRHILEGHNLTIIKALKCLRDALNVIKNKKWTSKREKWEQAIIYADLYNDAKNTFDDKIEDYARQCNVAKSAIELVKMGVIIKEINGNGIFFEHNSLAKIIRKLDKKIEKFGGINLISCIFKLLSKNYSNRLERYFFCREVDSLGNTKIQIPYGFLLNLALKHINSAQNNYNKEKIFNEIIEDSKIIISAYCDVQPYSQWEFIYPSEDLISYCKELVLWDSIFSIEQCKPSLAIEMIEYLIGDISESEFYDTLKIPKIAFFFILKQIFRCNNNHRPISLKTDDFKKLPYGCYAKDILEILSHKGSINKAYLLPNEYTKLSYYSKPFVRMNDGYLIPNSSWAASTIFEALVSIFRNKIENLDEMLGKKIEDYLKKKFTEKGITFISGEIISKTEQGECDIIIESSRRIIFIELKKKVLTAKARSGYPINLFVDLSLGFLNPIVQTYRNEYLIVADGKLSVKQSSDGTVIDITRNDRDIERIAVSKMEYNSFTDEMISRNLLCSYYKNSFSVGERAGKKIKDKISQITGKQKKLRKYVQNLSEKDNVRDPFFNSHFRSLIQIIEVINDSTSNEDFCENLLKAKHITTASLDWYFEYERAKSINRV